MCVRFSIVLYIIPSSKLYSQESYNRLGFVFEWKRISIGTSFGNLVVELPKWVNSTRNLCGTGTVTKITLGN